VSGRRGSAPLPDVARRLIALLLAAAFAGCRVAGPDEEKGEQMAPSKDFENVAFNTFEKSDCSPELDDDFRGMVIAVPETIVMKGDYAFPVCGSYQVASEFYGQFESFSNQLVVVAVDASTHTPYSATLLDPEFEPGVYEDDEFDEDDVLPSQLTGWFNVNLFDYLDGLPRKTGTFHVYAMVGDLKSNVCNVEVVRP